MPRCCWRKNSVAELEARKLRLAAKQEALEETFQEAAEKIAALDGSVYLDFIVKTLEPYREEGGEISLNARLRQSEGQPGERHWQVQTDRGRRTGEHRRRIHPETGKKYM